MLKFLMGLAASVAVLAVSGCAPPEKSAASICAALHSATRLPVEVPTKAGIMLESINDVTDFANAPVTIRRSDYLTIVGWAYDWQVRLPASAIYLDIDKQLIPAQYGIGRPDVAMATRNASLERTGFAAVIPWECIGNAKHTLTVKIVNHEKTASYAGVSVEFVAEGLVGADASANLRFAALDDSAGLWGFGLLSNRREKQKRRQQSDRK